jgi:cytochrome c-type biogenesis protein CcmF
MQRNRGLWNRLNVTLGLLPFVWFIYGTYLTRSGALGAGVSVHSFAEMNSGAKGILLAMVSASAVAMVALAIRAFRTREEAAERNAKGQRTLGITIGMSLLYGIALMAAYGMSLPFIGTLLGRQKEVVAEKDYNLVVAFPFVPALILMAIVPFMGWTKTASERAKTLGNLFLFSVFIFGISTFILVKTGMTLDGTQRLPAKQLIVFYTLVYVCIFAIVANAHRTIERLRSKSGGIGAFVTHAGVAMLLLGLIVSRAFEKTDFDGVTMTQPGRLALLPDRTYLASLEKLPRPEQMSDPNNRLEFLVRNVSKDNEIIFKPNFYYEVEGGKPQPISRPDIIRRPLYDLYFVVGAPETEIESDIDLTTGEKKTVGQFEIEYVEKTQAGEPGRVGTKFGAKLRLTIGGKTYAVHPEMEITASGPKMHPAEIKELGVSVELRRLMATDGSATLSIISPELIFPVQLFFKPMTILVWLGAGLMTVGGVLSIYRVSKNR